MLHPIPESTERTQLFAVVKMQRRLIEALCGLSSGAAVDQDWLQGVWPGVPAQWIKRFWKNNKGNRAEWLKTIAAASASDKRTIRRLMMEQLRFRKLYQNTPNVRLTQPNWKSPVFDAFKRLLKSFYDPLFYKDEGYHNSNGELFHKDHFIEGFNPRVIICPYTDNILQDTKLDHFLPKDQFPMLSCHPDNLVPCSTDSNSISHKGTKIPLNTNESDQAAAWFHPYLRTAAKTYYLTFPANSGSQPEVKFLAFNPSDQPRVDNMEKIFGLNKFWGGFLADEVQSLAGDIQGWLEEDKTSPTQGTVKNHILKRARQERNRIGRDALAIVKSFFYEHIANTQVLLDQVVRTCSQGI